MPTSLAREWHCHICIDSFLPFYTCWIPLTNITGADGRLVILPGSHKLRGYNTPIEDGLLPGEYTEEYAKAKSTVWQWPTQIGMGDVILFNFKTIHAATKNIGGRFRLSVDTRVTTNMRNNETKN